MTPVRRPVSLILAALAVSVAVLASGCGLLPSDPPPAPVTAPPGRPAVALVLGRHTGAADPALTPLTRPVVEDAVAAQGYLAIVVADGEPRVDRATAFTRECQSGFACDARTREQLADLDGAVAGLRPGEPETDLLGALREAGRSLPASSGPRTVVVADPGLSTAGALRFPSPGVLRSEPRDVVRFLAGRHELPDLRGVAVVFAGQGDTADPQPRPDGTVRANVRAIWAAVASAAGAAGAASVRFDDAPLTGPTAAGLPPVTTVPMPAPPTFDGSGAELTDAVVGFAPDTAVLRDPVAARAALTPLAERARREPLTVTLTGTTSSAGGPDELRRLSLARADAVKAVLVGLGVPAERIRTRGDGYVADPPDTVDGTLLPGPAAENRRVRVRLDPLG